jgi:hypothetical protein
MMAKVRPIASPARLFVAWGLSLMSLGGAFLGWAGLYAMASPFAAGTVWWVGALFMASGPAAVAGLVVALRPPRLLVPAILSGLAAFGFVAFWILVLGMKFEPQ